MEGFLISLQKYYFVFNKITIMKKYFCLALCSFVWFSVLAQSVKDSVQLKAMLFEKFMEGKVLMKSGEIESAPLNYNTDDQSIVFIKNGQYLVLTGLDAIDTVYIQNKRFIPVNETFYEVVASNSVALLAGYSNKGRPLVATADHNGSSKQSGAQVSNTVSDTYVNRIYKGNYRVEISKNYWIKKDSYVNKANSKKQFVKLFSSKQRNLIEKYISERNIDFANEGDMVSLVNYCNEIK